jgi:hypothetical protein
MTEMTEERVVRKYVVLTGDLVKSGLFIKNRGDVIDKVKVAFNLVSSLEKGKKEFIVFSRIYRGDSFQAVVSRPPLSLKAGLLLRAEVLKLKTGALQPDARIGFGLGPISAFHKNRIEESDGEAFRQSGRALESIKSFRRFHFCSGREDLDGRINRILALVDAVVQHWTVEQAEAVSYWLMGLTQGAIAAKIGITQSAVQQRLRSAGHFGIEDALASFADLL